jgi:histidinol-phosphate phosphatase family protein
MITENIWLNPNFANTRPRTAIFADRDGTLIQHVDYISDPAQVELLPGVKQAVHQLLDRKTPFFVLTNQSGVGRGYFTIEQVHACQKRMFELMEIAPNDIAGWCIAPEAPSAEGGYRKPSPRFIQEALAHLGNRDAAAHMIGDTLVDLETAWNAGANAWAVACGKPQLPKQLAEGIVPGAHTLKDDFAGCINTILTA